MKPLDENWKFLIWAVLAGALAGCCMPECLTNPRSVLLALILALGLKRIYVCNPEGEVISIHPRWRVVLTGVQMGLLAGVLMVLHNGISQYRHEGIRGIEDDSWVVLPYILISGLYGAGLYLACASRHQKDGSPWRIACLTALVPGILFFFITIWVFPDIADSLFAAIILTLIGPLPFCLIWLGTVLLADPYGRSLRRRQPEPSAPAPEPAEPCP